MSEIWYEISITKITFVLIVHRWIAEVPNLCIAERKLRILYEYSTFHLGVAHYFNIVNDRISFTLSIQALVPDGAGLVCGEKSGVLRAGFYNRRVLSTEVSGLMHLS